MTTTTTTNHEGNEQIRAPSPVPVLVPASAPDPSPARAPSPAPVPASTPIYETPDWEIPTNYPPPKRSFRNSLTFLNTAAAAAAVAATASRNNLGDTEAAASAESGTAAKETTPDLECSNGDSGGGAGAKPTLAATARQRFNAVLPPHKKYLGRSRRFLLLCVVLPIAILLFVVLPLAVGLGVGLSRRRAARSSSQQNLPLPTDGDNGGIFTGELTYYDVGLGACGVQSSDEETICSISQVVFDAAAGGSGSGSGGNPNANPLCGRKIRITRDFSEVGAGNRSVDVTVVDRCTGCEPTDLDLSIGAFEQLALQGSGRVVGSWAWLDDDDDDDDDD